MNEEQLRKKIRYSLNERFTEKEIRQVLRQQGVKHSRINQALNQVKNQGNQNTATDNSTGRNTQRKRKQQPQSGQQSQASRQQQRQNRQRNPGQQKTQRNSQDFGSQNNQNNSQSFQNQNQQRSQGENQEVQNSSQDVQDNQQMTQRNQRDSSGLDLTDSYYRIKQQLLLTRYSVFDQSDEKILKAKAKIFSIKTNIPFSSPDSENPIFRVLAARFPNISNNYKVKDEQNDDVMAILDRKRTLLNQVWRIRDPQDNSIVATIQNESTMLQFLRSYGGIVPLVPNLFALAPHTYQITDVNDSQIGELEGELSIRDEYELNLEDSGQLDRRDMISSIIAIDALEGN